MSYSFDKRRYSRQTVLPEVGVEGQARLSATRVLCVGAGGLGSPALLYLAAAGMGTLGIIDPDQVEISNLQRQVIFTSKNQAENKAQAAADHLHELNPDVRLRVYQEALSAHNAEVILADYDIIVDGTDNFAAKFLINDVAVKLGKPMVYGAISGFEGHASVFWAKHGPCYRCLYPSPPKSAIPNCAEAGVIGAVAGMIGTMQALEAFKLALGIDHCRQHGMEPLIGRMLSVNMKTLETQTRKIHKQAHCVVCSIAPENIRLQEGGASCASMSAPQLSWSDVTSCPDYRVVDVRETDEWNAGHYPGAEHFPLSRLRQGEVPPWLQDSRPVALYCQRGKRSLEAITILRNKKAQQLFSITGGIEAWNGPLKKTPQAA